MTTQTLPILQRRAEIEAAIRSHQVVIVCGETGSGKTTQLPQICWEAGVAAKGMIGHTQPRRIAARAVAARIAEEMDVRLGGLVGVKVRFQDQTSHETRIKLMTDGMLLAELGADPQLRDYSVIIIDEAHERSLNIDFLLGYIHRLLPRRPELKVVITSATIDPRGFSDHFGGPEKAPVIEVSGRTYPVEIRYHPRDERDEADRVNPEEVADAVEELLRPSLPEGDVLVFLPGEREIRMTGDALRRRAVRAEVLPLLARLTAAEQDRIFHPAGGRRVILATNVAETSLTVPGVRYVVDTGLARQSWYDPERKVQRLPIEPVSRASANQRSGRCGRVADGVCIRLYSEQSYSQRPAFTEPEIRRTNLASVVLQMKSLALGPIEEFPFLDPPDARAIDEACETLFELGALDGRTRDTALTPLGRDLARLPLDPRVGRMLLAAAHEGSLREVTILAAALSIQDPRERPMGRQDAADRAQLVFRNEASDFLTLLNIWDQHEHAGASYGNADVREWCREHFLSVSRMREWIDTARQLRDVANELGLREHASPASADGVHRALLTGLISNVACRDGEAGSFEYRGVRGNVISIFPGSSLFKKAPKWIMAAELVHTTKLYARTVARIEVEWVEELASHMLERRISDRHLDAETGEPSAWERVSINGIVVAPRRRVRIAPLDHAGARELFLRDGLVHGRWKTDLPYVIEIARAMAQARDAEARLRRRGVVRPDNEIVDVLEERLPPTVCDPASLVAWLEASPDAAPVLSLSDVLRGDAVAAFDHASFPSFVTIDGNRCELSYSLAPGKDEDGITLTVGIAELGSVRQDRIDWLVPGMLPEVAAAMIKTLPKPVRGPLEGKGGPEAVGAGCAAVIEWGAGTVCDALAEAIEVLYGVRFDPSSFSMKALPSHLRMRIRVEDVLGKEVAAGRELHEMQKRLGPRIQRASAARARAAFERDGLTTWAFAALPERVDVEREGTMVEMFPALVDAGTHVRLTLLERADEAERAIERGVRRLFALACAEEVHHHLLSMAEWDAMTRQHQQLGSTSSLRDQLTCQIAGRAFMAGGSVPRTKEQFEEARQQSWGRLALASREVVGVVASVLATRAAVAHRLASGTPRLWADSIADIREQAAYLMPAGFIGEASWVNLRCFPRYIEAMRERLFALREGGSGVEKAALQQFSPYWKRFTGWVATAMSAERAALAESPDDGTKVAKGKKGAPLPQTRRNSPSVNVDAGVWAMAPGRLPPSIERYRWALEDARVSLFVPRLASGSSVSLADLAELWRAAGSSAAPARG